MQMADGISWSIIKIDHKIPCNRTSVAPRCLLVLVGIQCSTICRRYTHRQNIFSSVTHGWGIYVSFEFYLLRDYLLDYMLLTDKILETGILTTELNQLYDSQTNQWDMHNSFLSYSQTEKVLQAYWLISALLI